MLEWISQNQQVISVLTGLGTLIVWMIYLQVFLSSYRRQLRANILIFRGAGSGLNAHCLVSNMSSGPVYVQSIIVTLHLAEESWTCPITELLDLEAEEKPAEPLGTTRQGPISTGHVRDMGTFRSILRHVVRHKNGIDADLDQALADMINTIEVKVLAIYGSQDVPVGAVRRFGLYPGRDGMDLRGEGLTTEQIRRRSDRLKLISLLEQDR